jgi:hypothetical protein
MYHFENWGDKAVWIWGNFNSNSPTYSFRSTIMNLNFHSLQKNSSFTDVLAYIARTSAK